jgi:hypothetical protein
MDRLLTASIHLDPMTELSSPQITVELSPTSHDD